MVDAFAGGGGYKDGSFGSPLLFADELAKTTSEINAIREANQLRPIDVECLLILNDASPAAIEQLKGNLSVLLKELAESSPRISLRAEFHTEKFENLYPSLIDRIQQARCRNVIFNLDQCGYSAVTSKIIKDTIQRWKSSEVFLTFSIESLLSFLSTKDDFSSLQFDDDLRARMGELTDNTGTLLTKGEWLGVAEKIVYYHFQQCAPYVSPFSINNPDGWQYWLMHFANSHRARQVYNNILHEDENVQAHYGRPGLRMLSYDPRNEGQLYLFDEDSRALTKGALHNEIPRLIAESGDAMSVEEFYVNAYSATPAHTNDLHEILIDNREIEVITESGGKRRAPGTIRAADTLKLTTQRNFFLMFPDANAERDD